MCQHAKAAAMSKGQIKSAVVEKSSLKKLRGKPTNVKTIVKKKNKQKK